MVVPLAILVGVAAACVLALSFFTEREIWDLDAGEGVLARLKKRKERLLRSIKDLETEWEAGALSEEEYRSLRQDFKRQAVAASRELDRVRQVRLRALEGEQTSLAPRVRERVEKLVAKRRKETA